MEAVKHLESVDKALEIVSDLRAALPRDEEFRTINRKTGLNSEGMRRVEVSVELIRISAREVSLSKMIELEAAPDGKLIDFSLLGSLLLKTAKRLSNGVDASGYQEYKGAWLVAFNKTLDGISRKLEAVKDPEKARKDDLSPMGRIADDVFSEIRDAGFLPSRAKVVWVDPVTREWASTEKEGPKGQLEAVRTIVEVTKQEFVEVAKRVVSFEVKG